MISNAYVKAVLAAIVAIVGAAAAGANGTDVSHLDIGQWISVLGTGLVTAGALLHNPKGKEAASVDVIIEKAAAAKDDLTKQALDGIEKAKAALGDLINSLPTKSTITVDAVGTVVPKVDEVLEAAESLAQKVISKVNG